MINGFCLYNKITRFRTQILLIMIIGNLSSFYNEKWDRNVGKMRYYYIGGGVEISKCIDSPITQRLIHGYQIACPPSPFPLDQPSITPLGDALHLELHNFS